MTIVEIAVGMAILGLVAATALASLNVLNRNAVRTRVMTNMREIVQRNTEKAAGFPFTTTNIPPILAMPANNVVWDENGGTNKVTIYADRDGNAILQGTLTRTVTAQANPAGADIRRVTFNLVSDPFFGKTLSYQMTTIRAMDK
jgi:hypothetical protein